MQRYIAEDNILYETGFENGSKESYTQGSVTIDDVEWELSEL